MSLTSYLTAPSRGVFVLVSFESFGGFPGLAATYSPTSFDAVPLARRHLTAGFGMGPGVLLVLWPPNRGIPRRIQPAPCRGCRKSSITSWCVCFLVQCLSVTGSNQACRAISTGQLSALLRLHLRPIDVVVYHGPRGYLVLRGASRLDAFSGYPVRS